MTQTATKAPGSYGRGEFFSPKGLYEFQAEAVVAGYEQWLADDCPALDVQYDMGLGKTILSLALACVLIEDNEIDRVLLVVEKNKVRDWVRDVTRFTDLQAVSYHGTPDRRARIRAMDPQVLVMTYETGRNDIAQFKPRSKRAIKGPGPLAEHLIDKRLLIVFDECTKLRNRTSQLHLAWDFLVNRYLRKNAKVMGVGLTGTKVESSPADHYNVNRLIAPHRAPSVEEFEATYVKSWDRFGNIDDWTNLDPAHTRAGITPLSEVFADITVRKAKTDSDVMDQFPDKMENAPRRLTLTSRQASFYNDIEDILHAEDDENTGLMTLRQIAASPATLLYSDSVFARTVVEQVGRKSLAALGSAKIDEAVAWAKECGDQQMVMFTFFGQSLLPLVNERLVEEGFTVALNHGQMSAVQRERSQDAFRAGDAQVFLSSDAGARGLNLQAGSALLHLELPLLASTYQQRSDRIHRIDSTHPSVTIDSLVVEGTIEEAIAELLLSRNEWSEQVSDGGLVDHADSRVRTASVRRQLWGMSKKRRRRR